MQKFIKIAAIAGILALVSWQAVTVAATAPDTKPADAAKAKPMKADTNGDGMLSRQEWGTMAQQRAENGFKRHDANGDGMVTREEIKAFREKNPRRRGRQSPPPPAAKP